MNSATVDTVLIRMDKIGDLVVSLPADEAPELKEAHVHWLITKNLGFVAKAAVPERHFSEFSRTWSWSEFRRLVVWLRKIQPRQAIVLHAPWWVGLALWWARVPVRMGRWSQWHSFLFLNYGIRQSRSRSDLHECDYNLQLIALCFAKLRRQKNLAAVENKFPHNLALRLQVRNPISTLTAHGLKPRSYRVVHPGMMGSSLNWPIHNYVELIRSLAQDAPVVVTGTASDEPVIQPIRQSLAADKQSSVVWLVGALNSEQLLSVLSQARAVIAPSTGVLHLAASLATPCLGLYSPLRVQRPTRWGPRGPWAKALMANGDPDDLVSPEVMAQIRCADVLKELRTLESSFLNSTQDKSL